MSERILTEEVIRVFHTYLRPLHFFIDATEGESVLPLFRTAVYSAYDK